MDVVLFPNMDGLVDLAAIDAFLAYHHSKESPVVAILADLFDTFDQRCEKSSARIICYLPALCVWLVSHLFQQDIRHPCPLRSHRLCVEKIRVDWDQHLAGIGGRTINWFPRWKEGKEGVLFSCGDYPNTPLIGMRGCINYNPALDIRQLGYLMRGAPTEESLSPFLVRDFGAQSFKIIQRVHKAWESPLRKDKELRGIRNGIIGGYHEWLKVRTRGLDWLSKLKIINEENFEALEEDEELVATNVRKECAELREENTATARALERETKRARKEEHGRDKFRGALWGSNNELELRRGERDQSRAHSMVLKEELAACSRSKRSLSQCLCETETNMLAIVSKYQEELNLATAHEHKVVDEYARVYAEKEARGRVIDSLHQEATMWMDRFALTLNGSQELPRLLAKAKAMADTYSAPEEIHGLLSYCQHMINLMIPESFISMKCCRSIGDQNCHSLDYGVEPSSCFYEKMKADMEAMKEQMATMMEAMMSMKKIMEANAVTVAATSTVAKVNPMPPSGLNQMNHPTSDMHAFPPYGLPPNYTPPNVAYIPNEDVNNSAPILIESRQPHHAHWTLSLTSDMPLKGKRLIVYPCQTLRRAFSFAHNHNPCILRWEEPLLLWLKRENLVFASERIEVGLKRGKFNHPALMNEKTGANEEGEDEGETHAVTAIPIRPTFPPTQQCHYLANNNPSPYLPPNYPQRPSLNQPQNPPSTQPMLNTTFSTDQNTNQGRNFAAKSL
ncbi:hypothetical protein HKD37_09G025317 [Glycine soja]